MDYFNVRVYGLLLDAQNRVLISDEEEYGMRFTKFPGGGVELGEGLREALTRELQEECGIAVRVGEHVYTTDMPIRSAFNNSQVIAVYYRLFAEKEELARIPYSDRAYDFASNPVDHPNAQQSFRWVPVETLRETDLTFDMDRMGWRAFLDVARSSAL